MSKFLRVDEGDYKITVQNGGQITLDTGSEEGTVVITGDLTVQGVTTTVETANMTIEDNIIVLNKGEAGAGITDPSNSSGLEIDRGSLLNAFFVYDDNLTDSVNGGGLFAFRLDNGTVSGIRTNHISTAGSDLHLINTGTGVITVSGTNNYEDQVTDDDDITNKKYVDDAISTAFATVFLKQIGDGVTSPSSIVVADSEPSPDGSGAALSNITFSIDGNVVSTVYEDEWNFKDIRITNSTIETTTTDSEDLLLRAWGTGSVRIDDTLHINSTPGGGDVLVEPAIPTEGAKIYVSDEYTGGTGIYFVNENETRDEIVSKNRALLFGMLF
jgi:hypothetical protein